MFYCPISLGIKKKTFKLIASDNNKAISECMKYRDVSYLLCYHSHCHKDNSLLSRTPLMTDLKDQKENRITKRTFFNTEVNIEHWKNIKRGKKNYFLSLKLCMEFCIFRQLYLHKALTFRNNVVCSSFSWLVYQLCLALEEVSYARSTLILPNPVLNSQPLMIMTVRWSHRDESVLKYLVTQKDAYDEHLFL